MDVRAYVPPPTLPTANLLYGEIAYVTDKVWGRAAGAGEAPSTTRTAAGVALGQHARAHGPCMRHDVARCGSRARCGHK